ncbi:MAG TPA: hypothetical protein DHW02_15950 [Ktedonobacter sp.]|nr:hypothetical protein [Ktedonobacter sp.]
MNTCPNCGGDTREIDRFCLHCGYPLTPNPAPYQQEQQNVGESTQASPDEWIMPVQHMGGDASWNEAGSLTVADSGTFSDSEPATMRPEAQVAQATMNRIEQPARLLLRSDSGEIIQEYPLDKHEITIGRAPASDILLSKDKLTSRRHATIHYENGQYILRDERSANGTFVNGQQIEELAPRVLQDGDHVGVGEHELIFHTYTAIEDMPTISVNYNNGQAEPMTYRTREDTMATSPNDEYGTRSMDNSAFGDGQTISDAQDAQATPNDQETSEPNVETQEAQEAVDTFSTTMYDASESPSPSVQPSEVPHAPEVAPSIPVATSFESMSPSTPVPEQMPVSTSHPAESSGTMQSQQYTPSGAASTATDAPVTFSRLTGISQPALPDMTALTAALSALDGQVMSLQEQLHSTQEAMRNHDAEVAQTANQLRTGVRRVSDRMDATIADVARSREALAWSELSQLMEEVMNNPRDIEYVTRLARKARELNKLFQIHQNVLNTMYECNSLLRGLIGEDH